MKVFLKIISPKFSASLQKEFTIEEKRQRMTIMDVVHKLKDVNSDVYTEIHENGFIHQNYICMVNNEIILFEQRNKISLKDGDNMVISFAIAGG